VNDVSGEPEEAGHNLHGRTAVVTGASRGIGAEIAQWLSIAGVRLALVARNRERLESVSSAIGGSALVMTADLSSEADTSRAASEVIEAFAGPPDILVNNAGVFQITPLAETSPDDFARQLSTNLLTPFLFIRAFLPAMLERGSGHIITIGSVSDRTIFPGNGAYAATKFGGRALHEVLRAETRGTGVRATLVSPGPVDTGIWDSVKFADGSSPERATMLHPGAVGNAVLYALTQPDTVNVDELRLSRS
jgi:NADP-dependent 3-hydroxy acid dehydrogenase YdfG